MQSSKRNSRSKSKKVDSSSTSVSSPGLNCQVCQILAGRQVSGQSHPFFPEEMDLCASQSELFCLYD